jgi:hypothetical protein
MGDVEDAAVARFRERVGVMVEQALAGYWRGVIASEAEFLVREGAERYLSFTDALAYASVRAELDGELRRILGGGAG